ncbi:MAG: hypothetical protein JJ992_05360 [Planctomycetes bacterium]|nr:hypothetical protein [Planctomycetota bacterium]
MSSAMTSKTAGRATMVRLCLVNRGRDEVTVVAALSTEALTHISAGAITIPPKGSGQTDLAGIVTDLRMANRAAVMMRPGDAKEIQRMVLPGAGFNFGLFGLKTSLTIPPGGSVTVPLLLVAVDTSKGNIPNLKDAERSPLIDLCPALRDAVSK